MRILFSLLAGATALGANPTPPPEPTETSKMSIRDVIHKHADEVAACAATAAKKKGTVVAAFTILPDGKVEKASVKSSTTRDAKLDNCVVARLRTWTFPNVGDGAPIEVGGFPFEFAE